MSDAFAGDAPRAPWVPDEALLSFIFHATGAMFSAPDDYKRTLSTVAQLAVPVLADWCAIDLRHDDGTIERVEVYHPDGARREAAAELKRYAPEADAPNGVAVAIRSGRSELVEDASAAMLEARATRGAPHLACSLALGIRSWIVVPLAARERILGALSFVLGDSGRRYTAEHLRVAEELGRRVALAIDNARLYGEQGALRARAEEQRARAEAAVAYQDELVAILGHDLRTPLATIRLSADTLARAPNLAPQHAAAVARVRAATGRMHEMIAHLLDFARARRGAGIPVEPAPARIEDVCARAIHELRVAHPGRLVELSLSGDGEGAWDAARLEQVVSNLVQNALQNSAPASTVSVRAAGDGDALTVEVHNEGAPIPADELPRIFEPFRRGNRKDSVGLGLFIVREIVRAHGGTVSVASGAESGTTFVVRLPRRAGAPVVALTRP